MIRLLRNLFATPEAERAPAEWALRFMGHFGLAAIFFPALLPAIGPDWSAVVVCTVYAFWEVLQWRGGWRMVMDGVLDWVAVALSVGGLWSLWHQSAGWALGFAVAAFCVIVSGVWRRG